MAKDCVNVNRKRRDIYSDLLGGVGGVCRNLLAGDERVTRTCRGEGKDIGYAAHITSLIP